MKCLKSADDRGHPSGSIVKSGSHGSERVSELADRVSRSQDGLQQRPLLSKLIIQPLLGARVYAEFFADHGTSAANESLTLTDAETEIRKQAVDSEDRNSQPMRRRDIVGKRAQDAENGLAVGAKSVLGMLDALNPAVSFELSIVGSDLHLPYIATVEQRLDR